MNKRLNKYYIIVRFDGGSEMFTIDTTQNIDDLRKHISVIKTTISIKDITVIHSSKIKKYLEKQYEI